MNFMAREMRTHGRLLRTKVRVDDSGIMFVRVAEPRALLTFQIEHEGELGNRVAEGIENLFFVAESAHVDVKLLAQEENELLWAVSALDSIDSPNFVDVLQVA